MRSSPRPIQATVVTGSRRRPRQPSLPLALFDEEGRALSTIQRVEVEDFLIPAASFTTPVEIDQPVEVKPGFAYQMLVFAEFTGADNGGSTPVIRFSFGGIEFWSVDYGPGEEFLPLISGGRTPGNDFKIGADDNIFITAGEELKVAVSIESAGSGLQSSVPQTLDRLVINFIG